MREFVKIWLDIVPSTKTAQGRRWRCPGPMSYQPTEYKEYLGELEQAIHATLARPDEPLDGAMMLKAQFVYPYQAGDTKTKAQRAKLAEQPFIPHSTKPDYDNSVKAPQDALQKTEFIVDDSRIFHGEITQWRGPKPGIMFEIIPFEEDDPLNQNLIREMTEGLPV